MKLSISRYFDPEPHRFYLAFHTDMSPHNLQQWCLTMRVELVSRESVLLAVDSLRHSWESAR